MKGEQAKTDPFHAKQTVDSQLVFFFNPDILLSACSFPNCIIPHPWLLRYFVRVILIRYHFFFLRHTFNFPAAVEESARGRFFFKDKNLEIFQIWSPFEIGRSFCLEISQVSARFKLNPQDFCRIPGSHTVVFFSLQPVQSVAEQTAATGVCLVQWLGLLSRHYIEINFIQDSI